MKSRDLLIVWLVLVGFLLSIIGVTVYTIDPYFHYHEPKIDKYFYTINNQRSQNHGIVKHFEYDALITGTSMTENFKTSEMDSIFGVNSIKVSNSGATFKETNDLLETALENNPNLKIIVRSLEMRMFLHDSNTMRHELGTYPTYLYDDNPFNDVNYLFNKDVVFGRVYPMILNKHDPNTQPGITSFDHYSNWHRSFVFGKNSVSPEGIDIPILGEPVHLTDRERERIKENIEKNVTSIAETYPNVLFYYFIPPYSVLWWKELIEEGTIYRQIEAEKYIIELILEQPNIKLYSFNNRTDITTDINHYKDYTHYGQWINTLILKWMYEDRYLLTTDNYEKYLNEEFSFYSNYKYDNINEQDDYENDSYAAALLNQELSGVKPVDLLSNNNYFKELSNALLIENQYDGGYGVKCIGRLQRNSDSEVPLWDYLNTIDYNGIKISIPDTRKYNYLVFYGKKINDHGQATVYVYDHQNEKLTGLANHYSSIDNEWHQYIIDLTEQRSELTVIFHGGYVDDTGSIDSTYIFSKIMLY